MIALAAGLIVSTAAVAFLMSSFRSNGEYVRSTKLTQELRSSLDLITRDLRRAGYDEKALAYLATSSGSQFSRMRLCDASDNCAAAATPPNTCVIYAYDRVGGTDATITPEPGNGEIRGIRLKQRSVNGKTIGVIEYAVSTGTTKPVCSGLGPDYTAFPVTCNTTTTWCPLSDPAQLDITALTFTDTGTATGGVQLRDIDVVLQGRIAGTTDFTRGVRSNIRIRSECFDSTLSNCSLSP
jgi:type II secretory pathway component PulJ